MRKQHKKMPSEKSPITRSRRQKGAQSSVDSRIEDENLPSLSHIPKYSLDSILHYLLLQQIKKSKQPSLSSSFAQKRHRYFLFQYYKDFQLKSRLKESHFRCLKTPLMSYKEVH